MIDSKWNGRFMSLAREISTWSKDPSTGVGAVIVDPISRAVVSTGYNGFPSRIKDTVERLNDRETKYEYTIHAEINAILNAAKIGSKTDGCYIYVYGLPVCAHCALSVIQSGISSAFWEMPGNDIPERWHASVEKTTQLFREANIYFNRVQID